MENLKNKKTNKDVEDILEKGKDNCCGCYACYNICPVNAITMARDEKGFSYPEIDRDLCINCGLCYDVCPTQHPVKERKEDVIAYAAYSKNKEERLESSSGGIFSLLAKVILEEDGIVFGAAFNDEHNVEHIEIETLEDLYKLRGSKYVQSEIKDTYKKAREYLQKNKKVLFSGTPCQIEGLYNFLKKDYDNLYTTDIVCHGVPSQKVWQKYLKETKENENFNDDLSISFRNKDKGWLFFSFKIKENESKKKYLKSYSKDVYLQSFTKNLSLRNSCFSCQFKKKHKASDITLGDLWGSKKIAPELDDDLGLSTVVINSNKGREFMDSIKEKVVFQEINIEDALIYNSPYIESVKPHKNREKFFSELDDLSMKELGDEYLEKKSIKEKTIYNLRKIKRKLDMFLRKVKK